METPHPDPLPIATPTPQRGEGEASVALRKERLPVDVVQHIHRLAGGDARTEKMVADYIQFRWKAPNLFYIPPKAAGEIIRRPADFLTAAKNYSEPELQF